MPVKTCKSDAILTQVLQGVLPFIISPLMTLINLPLQEGVFAEFWEMAIVCPLIKKLGLELVYSNYRPVSNLTFTVTTTTFYPIFSQLTDKIIAQKHL